MARLMLPRTGSMGIRQMLRLKLEHYICGAVAAILLSTGFYVGKSWGMRGKAKLIANHNEQIRVYTEAYANSVEDMLFMISQLNEDTEHAINEKNEEIARLSELASRAPSVIRVPTRVTVPAPTTCSGGETHNTGGSESPTGGVLPGGVVEGYRDLDISAVNKLMLEADKVSADLRAVLKACRDN